MMTTINKDSKIVVKFAWWLVPYMHMLAFFCHMSGRIPDWEKFNRRVKKAIRFKIVD